MNKENSTRGNGSYSSKKIIPIVLLVLVTVGLMLFFRHNKKSFDSIIETGRKNLLSFYTENLKPLFFRSEITNEDVFNFAFNRKLPIDKQNNKVLLFENRDSLGNQLCEIKLVSESAMPDNYESFKRYFQLNSKESEQLDSILNSYKESIYSSVWVNDKNTIAINPKLPELHEAILTDMLWYVYSVDKKKLSKLFPMVSIFEKNKLKRIVSDIKSDTNKNFIFITPDTVLDAPTNFSRKEFKKQYSEWEKNIAELKGKMKNWEKNKTQLTSELKKLSVNIPSLKIPATFSSRTNLWYSYDYNTNSNTYKIVLPVKEIKYFAKSLTDSLRDIIELSTELAMKGVEKSLSYATDGSGIKVHVDGKEEINANLGHVNEILIEVMKEISKGDTANWEKFSERIDSIAAKIAKVKKDSILHNKNKLKGLPKLNSGVR